MPVTKDLADKEESAISAEKTKPNTTDPTSAVLTERGARYGEFKDHAAIAQRLQDVMRSTTGWDGDLANGRRGLEDDQRQALTVISDKIARILNGDPNYLDNWLDISGYSMLVYNRLKAEGKE